MGVAWRNYTAWHIKGEQRKLFLEKTIDYFKTSFDFAKKQLPIRNSSDKRAISGNLDQLQIASEIGRLLTKEAQSRDFEEAKKWFGFVYNNTDKYEPCFCYYAELFYKLKDYEKCAEIALNAYEKAKKDVIDNFYLRIKEKNKINEGNVFWESNNKNTDYS